MPKGSTPTENMLARYQRKLSENNREFNNSIKFKRKIISLFRGEDAATDYAEARRLEQRTVSQRYHNNEQYIRKVERSLLRR